MRILYFAWLRHRVGIGQEDVALPAGIATVGDLGNWLAERHPGFREAWESPGVVRVAVNHEHVDADAALAPDDEVAFFPPVTGG